MSQLDLFNRDVISDNRVQSLRESMTNEENWYLIGSVDKIQSCGRMFRVLNETVIACYHDEMWSPQ
jgi:hypothetical protein